jgi:hypothetical protein
LLSLSRKKEFPMNEIFFLVEEALEGGYAAKALGESFSPRQIPSKNFMPMYGMRSVATSMRGKRRR